MSDSQFDPAETDYLSRTDDICGRIRQQFEIGPTSVLLVEGVDDQRVLESHFDGVQFFPCSGRENAIDVLRNVEPAGENQILAVVDHDFVDPEVPVSKRDRVFYYEGRDLEGMLIEFGVLANMLKFVGSEEKIRRLGGAEKFINRLKEEVSPLGRIRYANHINNWGINFGANSIADRLKQASPVIDWEKHCRRLVDNSSGCTASKKDLVDSLNSPLPDDFGPSGKDVLRLLSIYITKKAGSRTSQAGSFDVLLAHLHSSAAHWISKSDWKAEIQGALMGSSLRSV